MNTAELLKQHNELAMKAGKITLKSWKGSKDTLIKRINELKKTLPNRPANHIVADKLIEKEAQRRDEATKELTITEVCKLIHMDPKVARAKLRRLGKQSNEGRWPLVIKDSVEYKELVKVLKGISNE